MNQMLPLKHAHHHQLQFNYGTGWLGFLCSQCRLKRSERKNIIFTNSVWQALHIITAFRWLHFNCCFDAALRIARIDAQLFNCIGAQHRLSMSQHFQNTFRHKRNRCQTRDRASKKRAAHWVESNSGFHFVHGLLKHRICTLEKYYTFFIFNWILAEAECVEKTRCALGNQDNCECAARKNAKSN